MTAREVLVKIQAILKKHNVVDSNVSESVVDTILDEDVLNLEYSHYGAFDLFCELFEERTVSFDIECIGDDGDYVCLIEYISKATCGEWIPKNINDSVDIDNETASVEFTDNDELIKWEFDQESDYVAREFFENLFRHLYPKLTGAFVSEGDDTSVSWIYLPKQAVEELINMDMGFISAIDSL